MQYSHIALCNAASEDAAAKILMRRIDERCPITWNARRDMGLSIELARDPGIGNEGFAITDTAGSAIRIAGADTINLLAGIGHFLRDASYDLEGFRPGLWRGISRPQKELRGIYFATHFHNYYHDAPEPAVERYIEDLALWGFNVLTVWYDMHHYHGIADPKARAMIQRLHGTLAAARRVGMRTCMGVLANEAYADSPVELRADPNTSRGHYRRELCPSKPGASELILRWFDEEFRAFADIQPDYLWIWPYDQGGCACEQCRPWGANGFLKIARRIAALFKQYSPQGRIILSTWLFDYVPGGEWEGLARQIDQDRLWIDYILADAHELKFPPYLLAHGVPGGLPLVNFPEISMYGMTPWGGFGANPQPAALQRLWDAAGRMIVGGFPYSEGIFEDFNKAIMARFYWDGQSAEATARDYIGYEFGPESANDVLKAIRILEVNQPRVWKEGDYARPVTQLENMQDHGAAEALALMSAVDARLPLHIRSGWRWRIMLLRALIDDELFRNRGVPTPTLEPWFKELVRIYHAQHADYVVHPPTAFERQRVLTPDQS